MAVHLKPKPAGIARTTSDFFPDVDADGFGHDEEGGFSLFLQERCKRIFFIRHAECATRGSNTGRAGPRQVCNPHT